jgi:photosystem II stability/assembly factor-like uncharacterized protein
VSQVDAMTDFEQLETQDVVYTLAAAPGKLLAGRASGLYQSTDAGASWQPVDLEQSLAVTALATADSGLFVGVNGGVLRSSDGGQTWFTAALSLPPPLVTVLAISPAFEADGLILAATAEDGVFASTDRGAHWSPWNFGLIDLNVFALVLSPDFAQDQTAYVGTESGVFRSKNGGRAWRALPFPLEAAPVLSLAVVPGEPQRIYAGTETHGLLVSADQGQTWQPAGVDLIQGAVNNLSYAAGRLWALLDETVVAADAAGEAWQVVVPRLDDTAVTFLVDGDHLLVGLAENGIRILNWRELTM